MQKFKYHISYTENDRFCKGAIPLMRKDRRRLLLDLLLGTAMLLVIGGILLLGNTFTAYNELFLSYQDRQLREVADATDENIAGLVDNLSADLDYVLARRGFVTAEQQWAQTGNTQQLLFRMQENLASQNPMVHAMLAFQGDQIFLSTDGNTDYLFPDGREGILSPCYARDGTLYLALFSRTEAAEYALLVDAAAWYNDLSRIYVGSESRLLLMGSSDRILLHKWAGEARIDCLEELGSGCCDTQALQLMLDSMQRGEAVNTSYQATNCKDGGKHTIRISVIPPQESVNRYFTVAVTCHYDEIVRPMHQAVIRLILSGITVMMGVCLAILLAVRMAMQSRQQDQEMTQLRKKSEETQKLLEKTQALAHHQRLETIGTLASGLAHDINNLLTPIMGYAILTLEGLPEGCDELADNVTEIYEASRKAKEIISQLGALSRKRTAQHFARVSLKELAAKALQVASPAKPDSVSAVIRCEGDCCLTGDETQLSQLLLNLILNAYYAMAENGGTLTLTMETADACAILTVADTGVGIPAEALPHIFEPFFTTRESGKGTGLGLAIVHQVVESHQGEIQVESTVGKGTVFTLRFPLEPLPGAGNS